MGIPGNIHGEKDLVSLDEQDIGNAPSFLKNVREALHVEEDENLPKFIGKYSIVLSTDPRLEIGNMDAISQFVFED